MEITRRELLPVVSTLATALMAQSIDPGKPKPFKVSIPKSTLDRIMARVRDARFPDRLDAEDWRYGANWDYMKALVEHWKTKYDWRKTEASLNAFPQFTAKVEDFDIHFIHIKGKGPRPMPLLLTHGWPGSVIEFMEAIGPLSDPAAHGGSADDAFDVIVPSLPGFGFSSKPKGKPVGPVSTARMWHKLMTQNLGYTKYGAQGGDWGAFVTMQLAQQFPEDLLGIHLNAAVIRPVPEASQGEEEKEWRKAAAIYSNTETDYSREHRNKPQTVAFALADSPVGTAAWIVEKLKVWSDSANNLDAVFTKDQVLSDVMMYLVTDTAATGVWYYRGSADDTAGAKPGRITVPTGFASFPHEMTTLGPPKSALERDFNLTRFTKMPKGGHFGCFEQPKLFVDDVRAFFKTVRG